MDEKTMQVVTEDTELQRCLNYLLLRDQGKTIEEIATFYHTSRSTIYNWQKAWQQDGTYQRARQLFLLPKVTALMEAIDTAINEMPEIIARQVEIAKKGGERNSLESAKWLYETLIRGSVEEAARPTTREFEYIEDDWNFNPIDVSSE